MDEKQKEQIMRDALVRFEEYQGEGSSPTPGFDRNLSPSYVDQVISDLKRSGNFEKVFVYLIKDNEEMGNPNDFHTGRSRDEFELMARPGADARKFESLKKNGPLSVDDIRFMANYEEPEQMMSKEVEPTVRELDRKYWK